MSESPAWALWIQCARWDPASRLTVVPLLSPNAIWEEAIEMRNREDKYLVRRMSREESLLSLPDRITCRRVAVLSVVRRGSRWWRDEVAGPYNEPVPKSVKNMAKLAVDTLNLQYKAN